MWIEIFRTGKFTDSAGREAEYSAEQLDCIVAKYNEKISGGYSAPLVKGHPASNEPALGWVERLARRGEVVLARLKDVSQEVIGDVRSGQFKKVSIALYPDLLLRHVGLLGAAQPAVQGLRDVEFGSNEDYLEYSSDTHSDSLKAETDDIISLLKDENKCLQAELFKLKEQAKSREYREFAQKFFDEHSYFANPQELIDATADLLVKADRRSDGNREFSENESLTQDLMQFFNSLKPAELFTAIKSNYKQSTRVDDFSGKKVNTERLDMHNSAMALLDEFPEMSYQQALNQVCNV